MALGEAGIHRVMPWLLLLLLLLLLPTLMMAGDVRNHSWSLHEDAGLGENAVTGESTTEGSTAGILGTTISDVWQTVQPNTAASDNRLKSIKNRLLVEAEDMTRLYASAAAGGSVTGTSRARKAVQGGPLDPSGGLRYLDSVLSRLDLSFFNTNTSVDVVQGVEGLAFLGLRGAQKMYMTQWRGRLIFAVINSSSVSLFAVERGTHKVHMTVGPRGRHACEFALVAMDRLLLVCITVGEPEQFEEVFGNQTNTMGKVTVYEIKEDPITRGHGPLVFGFVHDIDVDGPRYVEIWNQRNATFCLIVSGEAMMEVPGEYGGRQRRITLHTASPVYRWNSEYFDVVEQLPGTNPVAAHHFKINEFHYLAFANYEDNKGRHNCDSMIFRFCVDQERYLPFQTVKTRGAKHMHSFTLGSRPLHHTFLAIANFCEDTRTGTCSHHTVSGIYLYHLGKFVLFQEIKTAYAVQWMAIQINTTVLLALASTMRGVTFYQYNGWRFVPAKHQPRHQPFSASVTSLITANWDGDIVLGVTNGDDDKAAGHPSLYSVTFTTTDRLGEVYQEVRGWCEDMRRRVNRTEVQEVMQRVLASPAAKGAHTFTNKITIRGNLTVLAPSVATKVFVRSSDQWIPGGRGGGSLEARVAALEGAAGQAHQRLHTVVHAAGPATWPADLHFANLRVEGRHASSVGQVQARWINGRRVPDPGEAVPLHEANSLSSLTFAHVDLQAPASVSRLNGLPFSAYVTLNGHHELGGHVTFQGPVMAQSVAVTNTLDGVLVDPRSSLLTTHPQTYTGSLRCHSLVSDALHVDFVNDVHLAELLPRLVTRNGNVTITGPLRVIGDVVHRGSLWVKDIPSLDLVNPLLKNERGQQVVSGDHQVGGLATQAMAVEGRVNTVRIPADVFLNGSQYSYVVPSATFSNVQAASVSVTQAINSITVSEGSLEVLLLRGDQQVTAPKTFSSLHVLHRDSYVSGGVGVRRRRKANCGSLEAQRPTTPTDRSEALLVALRGVAAAQDVLSILAETRPGQFDVPWRTGLLFTLLKMDVNCAFILFEDTNTLMFFDILTEDWRNKDNETRLVLSHVDLTKMVKEVESYLAETVAWLHSIQFRWDDIWLLTNKTVYRVSDVRSSQNIVKVLIELIVHDYTMPQDSSEHCRWVCAAPQDEEAVTANCTQAAALTLQVAQRIARYPVLGSGLMQMPEDQRGTLLEAAVEHDLERLLEFLAAEEGLLAVLHAALYCGVAPRWQDNEVLKMLEKYKNKLFFRATYLDEDYGTILRNEGVQDHDGGLSSRDDQEGLAVTGGGLFEGKDYSVPEEEEEQTSSTTENSYFILTEKLSLATEDLSFITTKGSNFYEKSLVTDKAETKASNPAAHNSSPETEGSGNSGTEESTLVEAEDSLITTGEEITALTEDFFPVAIKESSLPHEENSTEKSSPFTTNESSVEETLSLPTHESVFVNSFTFVPKEYSGVANNELTLESSAISIDEFDIGQPFVATKASSIITEDSKSTIVGSPTFVIEEFTAAEPLVKNNILHTADRKPSTSSVEETSTGDNSNVTTGESMKTIGTARFPSARQDVAEVALAEHVQSGNRDFHVKPKLMAETRDAQSQAAKLMQRDFPFGEAEEEDEGKDIPRLVPSLSEFVNNFFSFGWLSGNAEAEEPRQESCVNEDDCTKKRETPDETTSLQQDRQATSALETSFSTPYAWDNRSSVTATPVLSQTQVDGLYEPNSNSPTLWEDAAVAIPQTLVMRENKTMTLETGSLANDWYRVKRDVTMSTGGHESSTPCVIHHTCVANGITTVTLVQHLTTSLDCTGCLFQYQIFQTHPIQPSIGRALYPVVTASTVTQTTLTIMMSSSSTSIQCTNCAFQYQIFTTQSVVPRPECASCVCVTGSTITHLRSTTVASPSPSSLQTWSTVTVVSPSSPQYEARTPGGESYEHSRTVPPGAPTLPSSVSSVESSHEWSSSKTHTSPHPSHPECGHIPSHYYEDSAQRDSLVAWLEVVHTYFKEIQSIETLLLQERKGVNPEQSEETTLRIIHKLMEDRSHFIRQIINSMFQSFKVSGQSMILESESFRMKMRYHLGVLKSFPDELKAKMNDLKNLVDFGEKSAFFVLQCLREGADTPSSTSAGTAIIQTLNTTTTLTTTLTPSTTASLISTYTPNKIITLTPSTTASIVSTHASTLTTTLTASTTASLISTHTSYITTTLTASTTASLISTHTPNIITTLTPSTTASLITTHTSYIITTLTASTTAFLISTHTSTLTASTTAPLISTHTPTLTTTLTASTTASLISTHSSTLTTTFTPSTTASLITTHTSTLTTTLTPRTTASIISTLTTTLTASTTASLISTHTTYIITTLSPSTTASIISTHTSTLITTTTPNTRASITSTHAPNTTASLGPTHGTTRTPDRTTVYRPNVTNAYVTPSQRPRVRTNWYSAATRKRVTQDYGGGALTRYPKTSSSWKEVTKIPPSLYTKDFPGMRYPATSSSWKEVTTTPPSTYTKASPGMRHPAVGAHGLWVLGRVAGHRLQDLVHLSSAHLLTRGGPSIFILNNMGRINNVIFNNELRVRQVQGVDMGRLLRHGLHRHTATVNTKFVFSSPVQVEGPLWAYAINGTPANAFVTLAGHHRLSQPFVFTGSVTAAAHVQVRGQVNGVDLALLNRSVVVTSPTATQRLLQLVSFARVSATNVVFAHGRVRGVPLGDLVRLDKPATITGRMTFKELTVMGRETHVTALNAHFINDVNVTDLFFNSLTKNPGRAQVIRGPIEIKTLKVLGNIKTTQGLAVPDARGTKILHMDRVAQRVVFRDQDANVTGNLLLRGRADIGHLIFRDSFDSVPAATYASGWLLKTSSQAFRGRVVMEKVKAQSVTVAPGAKLNGVDVTRLFKATMKINEDEVVTTPVKMSGSVRATSVWVGGTVQGWDLSTAAILRNSSDVVFTAHKKFVDAFHVSGALTASDNGGAGMSRLCRRNEIKRLFLDGEVQLKNLSSDEVHLGHHVLNRDSLDGYWRLNHDVVLASHMTFQEMKATHVKVDSVNGKDFTKLSRDILRKTCERQVVGGYFSAPFLEVQSLFTPNIETTLLNDHLVSDFGNILTREGRQTVQGRWTLQRVHTLGSMITSSGVNGLRMTDICVFDKPCIINARKTFARDLVVKGDMHVQPGRTVQGVDVSEELSNIVTTTSCGAVPGLTTITGNLTVSHLVVHGLVDDVKVSSKDLLTRSGAQVMEGRLTIKATEGALAAAAPSMRALDGLFNGWNLSERWQRGFRRDQDITVWKPVVFRDEVNFQNVVRLPWSPSRIEGLPGQRIHYLDELSQDTTRAVSGAARELWGWRRVQMFQCPAVRVVPLGMEGGPPGTLTSCPRYLVATCKAHAVLLPYDTNRRMYNSSGVVLSGGCVRAVAGYRAGGEDHVVTAHTCTDDSKDTTGSLHEPVAEGLEAVQVWRVTTSGPQLLHRIAIGATDVKVVEVGERVCLVVGAAGSNATLVFCWDALTGTFSLPTLLATGCSVKVSAAQHRDSSGGVASLVAVAGRDQHDQHNDALSLWLHDAEQDAFLMVQREALRGLVWVDMTSHGPDLFLAAVTRAFHGDTTGRIIVYRVEVSGEGHASSPYFGAPRPGALPAQKQQVLVHLQTLTMTLPLEAHFAAVPFGPLYLLAVGQHGNITRFTQKGIQRFAEEGLYHAPGRQEVDVWVCVEEDGGVSISMALAGTWCREEKCNERRREDAEILEANFRPGPPTIH